MNLNDLKNFDIKNIDVGTMKRDLKNRQDIVANILIIGLTIFIVFQIFSNKNSELMTIRTRLADLEKKQESIDKHKKFKDEVTAYLNELPSGLPSDKVIQQLSEYAEKRKVQILSFTPAKSKDKEYLIESNVALNVNATYKNLWLFIYDIENSPYNLRVDKWIGRTRLDPISGLQINRNDDLINVELEVAAINFKIL